MEKTAAPSATNRYVCFIISFSLYDIIRVILTEKYLLGRCKSRKKQRVLQAWSAFFVKRGQKIEEKWSKLFAE